MTGCSVTLSLQTFVFQVYLSDVATIIEQSIYCIYILHQAAEFFYAFEPKLIYNRNASFIIASIKHAAFLFSSLPQLTYRSVFISIRHAPDDFSSRHKTCNNQPQFNHTNSTCGKNFSMNSISCALFWFNRKLRGAK